MAAAAQWWTDAVGYQVYLPSFADSDGDGWGDLRGVLDRLGYLIELGVDMVWLTPFFRSPMVDGGYDVADYQAVDPRFGDRHAIVDRAPAVGEITPHVLTESGDVLALRRGPAWAVLNLADMVSVELILPAPAVYDTDDPAVCPERPAQPRPRRLAPQQAMLLHTVPHELHRTGGRL